MTDGHGRVGWQKDLAGPNELFMLFKADDLDKARAFVTSPKVPAARQASSVIGLPDIWFVRSA